MSKQSTSIVAKSQNSNREIPNSNPSDPSHPSHPSDVSGAMDMMNIPIRIGDAASMMRKAVPPNERPYTRTVLKFNNKLVDEWEEKVLRKICGSSGTILAGQVFSEWHYFYNGKTIKSFINGLNDGIISRPAEKAVEYWVDVFTRFSVKQLTDLGSPLVGYGWKLIIDETYIREQLNKWDKIYCLSDDPLQWRKLANDHPKLWNIDGESPFWGPDDFVNISEKVLTFLKTPIAPSQ
jgi:hypothetical protein